MKGCHIAPRLQYAYSIIKEGVRWAVEQTKVNALPPSKELQSTAYHEAGHAVISWALEYEVYKITIVPSGDKAGLVIHQNPLFGVPLDRDNSPNAVAQAKKGMMISLAGPIAQRKFSPESWQDHHGAVDLESVADYALRLSGSEEDANVFLESFDLEIKGMVDRYWLEIQNLASALLEKRTMTAEEVLDSLGPLPKL